MTVIQEYLNVNPMTLVIITIVITTTLILAALGLASIQKASARNIIDDLTLQSSRDLQSNAKPVKPAPSLQVVERSGPTIQVPFNTQGTTSASCEPGEIATGGGYIADVPLIMVTSKAMPNNAGWTITAHNGGSTNSLSVSAFAECATITSS